MVLPSQEPAHEPPSREGGGDEEAGKNNGSSGTTMRFSSGSWKISTPNTSSTTSTSRERDEHENRRRNSAETSRRTSTTTTHKNDRYAVIDSDNARQKESMIDGTITSSIPATDGGDCTTAPVTTEPSFNSSDGGGERSNTTTTIDKNSDGVTGTGTTTTANPGGNIGREGQVLEGVTGKGEDSMVQSDTNNIHRPHHHHDSSQHEENDDNARLGSPSEPASANGKRSNSSSEVSPQYSKIPRRENGLFGSSSAATAENIVESNEGSPDKPPPASKEATNRNRADSQASSITGDAGSTTAKDGDDLPRKKNLDERTLRALEKYLRSGDFLRAETLEYEDVAAYELKIHKYAMERMKKRQVMLLPEEVDETSHAKNSFKSLQQSDLFPEEQWMYNQIYQEEEFFSISNSFAKSVAIEAADRETSSFTLHNKTFNWVKRAAGLSRTYDPYSQRRPNTTSMSRAGGADDDSDDETDEGGESDAGPSGGRRLTRRRARMTRKKRREERLEKETEGLRILADVAKEMKKERDKQLAEERKQRKLKKQRRDEYGIDSSDDDMFSETKPKFGRRVRRIFGPLDLDSNINGPPSEEKFAYEPLSLSMLDWNKRMNVDSVGTVDDTPARPVAVPDEVSRMGFERIPRPLRFSKAPHSDHENDAPFKRRRRIAERVGGPSDEHNTTTFSAYESIPVGTAVVALHPKLQKEAKGKVLLHDSKNQEYLVQFLDKELGGQICNELDVVEDDKLILTDALGNEIEPDPDRHRHEIDREVLLTLFVVIKDTFDQILQITRALEVIADDKTLQSSTNLKEQVDWLLQNLKAVNTTMDAALKRFQTFYGKVYTDPESVLNLLNTRFNRNILRRHTLKDSKPFLAWSGKISSIINVIGKSIVFADDGGEGEGRSDSTRHVSDNGNGEKTSAVENALNSSAHLLLLANYLDQTIGGDKGESSSSSSTSKVALDAALQDALDKAAQSNLPPKNETELMDTQRLLRDSELETAFGELGAAVGMLRAELSLRPSNVQ